MTTPGRMAVTATLVFADEAHREMWLVQQGLVPTPDRAAALDEARFADYRHRRAHQNLIYTVGPLVDRDGRGPDTFG